MQSTRPVGSDDRGFNRIEALVVAACSSLLFCTHLALANPLGNRAAARTAMCADSHHRLILAWQLYAADNNRFFPPNPDDGNTTPGFNWVPGQGGRGGAHEFNPDILGNPKISMLAAYLGQDVRPFQCPAISIRGVYKGTNAALAGTLIAPARSVSMNGAVGTSPASGGKFVVDGPWLDNAHAHTRLGGKWRTYGRENDLLAPGPAQTAVIIEEDENSLNDGHFGFGMNVAEWIDWPATRHDGAGSIAFADGHVETHRWTDPRTRIPGSAAGRLSVPDSPDHAWLSERISALKTP